MISKFVQAYDPMGIEWIMYLVPCLLQETDDPVELSSTGRPKRKGRQDISYKLFFSENEDDEELHDFLKKRDDRFVT